MKTVNATTALTKDLLELVVFIWLESSKSVKQPRFSIQLRRASLGNVKIKSLTIRTVDISLKPVNEIPQVLPMPNRVPLETAAVQKSNDPNQTDGPFIQTRFQELSLLNHVESSTEEESQPTSVTYNYPPVPYRDKVHGDTFSRLFSTLRRIIKIKGYCFKKGKEGKESDEFLHSSFLPQS